MSIKRFENKTDNYPIVLVPDNILKYLLSDISEDEVADELGLTKPVKKELRRPTSPDRRQPYWTTETVFEEVNWVWIVIIPIVMIFCSIGLTDTFAEFLMAFFGFTIFNYIGISLVGEPIFRMRDREVLKYRALSAAELNNLQKKYQEDLDQYNRDVIAEDEVFKRASTTYQQSIQTNKERIRSILHNKNLAPSIKASRGTPPATRGFAEIKFLEQINSFLEGKIFIDMVPNNLRLRNRLTYNPDLTLICPTTGLHIDIEIDEPYALKDKQPIHYVGCDDSRNDFFIENNWCIIRFTEFQVIKQTKQCIDLISSVYESVLRMKDSYSSSVINEPCWTYEKSSIMVSKRFREQYLNTPFT